MPLAGFRDSQQAATTAWRGPSHLIGTQSEPRSCCIVLVTLGEFLENP